MDYAQLGFVTEYNDWNDKYRVRQNVATAWPLTSVQTPANSLKVTAPSYQSQQSVPTGSPDQSGDTNAAAQAVKTNTPASTTTRPAKRPRELQQSTKSIKAGTSAINRHSVAKKPKYAENRTQASIENSVL